MMVLESGVGNYVSAGGQKYSCFAGNNYLGLANHPDIIEASIQGAKKYGINFSASRLTSGTSDIHLELEQQLATFKQHEDAVVFASGYMGNKILLQILRNEYDAVFADQSAHSSILDAIPRDITGFYFYDHLNIKDLDNQIQKHKSLNPLVITDGIFALTGEIAPLDKLYQVVKNNNGLLVVDDAHSTGVLGDHGLGTPEHFGLGDASRIFQTETMSKAIGAYGGFIAGSKDLTRKIRAQSPAYGASTSLPPPLVSAAISALRIIGEHPELRSKMFVNAARIRAGLNNSGFHTTDSCTPIIPVLFEKQADAISLSDFLKDHFILAPYVSYPVKTIQFIVRITASAIHTEQQIDELLLVLEKWKRKNDDRC